VSKNLEDIQRQTNSEVSSVPGVRGSHHILGIEHLLGELGHCHGTVLLAATSRQGGETSHEEMKTRERNCKNDQYKHIGGWRKATCPY
jgi:hypothetical protein